MRYLLFILALAPFACLFGQTASITRLDGRKVSAAEIDSTVAQLMQAANVQGLNLGILNDNNVVFVKSYGYRNKPAAAPMDNNSIVYAASFSKAVFGYLAMALVDEKILDLDRPLQHYLKNPLPDYPYFADLKDDERWKLITARMCLSHRTGLPNVRWFDPTRQNATYDSLGVIKLYFTPGAQYAYSGEGFKLLELAIEEATGKNIDELAVERIFKPLGMTSTGYIWHDSFGDDNVAVGHMNNGDLDHKRKRSIAVAGGSLVTSISDYAKFVAAAMQRKGLSHESFEQMLHPQIAIHSRTQFPPISKDSTTENDAIALSYGLGWGLMDCPEYGRAFFKEGNGGPWRNYNINFRDKGTSIIIMTNSENGEELFQYLIEALLGNTCIPWKWQDYVPYDQKK